MSTVFQPARRRATPTIAFPAVPVSREVARENLIEAFSFLNVRRKDRAAAADMIQRILEQEGVCRA